MGYYRLLLALAVLASHVSYHGFDYGQSAVICFLLISGFVITKLVDAHYSDLRKTPLFYLDRAARIFPQYWFYCAATLLILPIAKTESSWVSGCTPTMVAGNVFPFLLYDSGGYPIDKCTLIPPAWSIALEWAFYLVIPFIANSKSKLIFSVVATYSIYTYIQAYLGNIDTSLNGLRHLSGTLFMFLVGVSLAREGAFWKTYRILIWVGSVALFSILVYHGTLNEFQSNKEVLAGLMFGIPALTIVSKTKQSKVESLAGNLSYGVFLNHSLVQIIFSYFHNFHLHYWIFMVDVVACSIILSWFSYCLIERPVLKWRRSLRNKREAEDAARETAPT